MEVKINNSEWVNIPKIEQTEYVVAYLDILGATKKMEENDNVFFQTINRIYTYTISIVDALKGIKFIASEIPQVKIFSDNI